MRCSFLFFATLTVACSTVAGDPIQDPDAALLPSDVGLFIVESSSSLDAAAIEALLPSTHRRVITTGFGLDPDALVRRLVDAQGNEHIFTIHRQQALVVERDRSGAALEGRRYDVSEPGLEPARVDPADVALAPDGSLWITLYLLPTVLVLAPDGTRRATVDLSAFDDDGKPEMTAIAIDSGKAYVALEKLTPDLQTKTKGSIVQIDLETRAASAFVDLPAKTPREKFVRGPDGALHIACIGGPLSKSVDRDAGIVRVDLAQKSAKLVFDGAKAGGFPTAFDLGDGYTGYAIVADFTGDNPTRLVTFDVATGNVTATWATSAGYQFWDVAAFGDLVLLADRTTDAPGLRILSRRDGSRLGHLSTRLSPIEFVVVRAPG
jgi:hypothetical protein